MLPAADYARVVRALDPGRLPAYVSYVESDYARGIQSLRDPAKTTYIRTKDGAVVAGPPGTQLPEHAHISNDSNPVSRPLFNPSCFSPTNEELVTWSGHQALRFTLAWKASACSEDDDFRFTTLYADPVSFQPLQVEGDLDGIDAAGVHVAIVEQFTQVGALTLPSALDVHVVGRGLLFWVRERGHVDYTNYQFYATVPEQVRRQSSPTSQATPH